MRKQQWEPSAPPPTIPYLCVICFVWRWPQDHVRFFGKVRSSVYPANGCTAICHMYIYVSGGDQFLVAPRLVFGDKCHEKVTKSEIRDFSVTVLQSGVFCREFQRVNLEKVPQGHKRAQ